MKYLRMVDVVSILRVHPSTLRRYEDKGLVTPFRDHRGIRHYTQQQVDQLSKIITPNQERIKSNQKSQNLPQEQ